MGLLAGIIFGLIAMVSWGLSNGISQVPIRRIGSGKTIFYRNIFTSSLLLLGLLLFLGDATFSLPFIALTFGLSLLAYIPLVTFFKALQVGKVGVIAPIANSGVIFTIIFSMIFFKETLTQLQGLSIALIIIGIILISINFKDIRKSHLFALASGIPLALISSFLWGLVFFLFKIPVVILGPILTSFIIEFGILIFSSANLKISRRSFQLREKSMLPYLFAVGLFGALALLSFNLGIRTAPVSIVAPLAFANPLVATLYGGIIYKEKLTFQQYFAILVILAGIVLISL